MSTKGFFTIAQGDEYVRLAYALALSLKVSQKEHNKLSIGITPGYKVPEKYKKVFDQVVEIPWGDAAEKSGWKLENEWKCIYMSPYDETIKLDADMIFPTDISAWWDILGKSDVVFATDVATYRGEKITSDFYRKTFTDSELPNIYTAFFYFNKSEKSYELFKLAEFIYNNWGRFFFEFLKPENRPTYVSTDVVFAIAAKILDITTLNNMAHLEMVPTFVHMKSELQNWNTKKSKVEYVTENWNRIVHSYFDKDCNLMIGNYRQQLPFHYHLKNFMTDEMISIMEAKLGL